MLIILQLRIMLRKTTQKLAPVLWLLLVVVVGVLCELLLFFGGGVDGWGQGGWRGEGARLSQSCNNSSEPVPSTSSELVDIRPPTQESKPARTLTVSEKD